LVLVSVTAVTVLADTCF